MPLLFSESTGKVSRFSLAGIEPTESGIVRKPDNKVEVKELSTAQQVLRLIDKLEDLDDVQAVHSNADIAEDILEKIAEQED